MSLGPPCYDSMFSWMQGRSEPEKVSEMTWPSVLLLQESKSGPERSCSSAVAQGVHANLEPKPRSHET